MALQHAARSSRGFTLIELMVVVIIATLLLSIAVPSYMSQIRQSRRTEAKTAILDLAGREERFLTTNPTGYTITAASLGYAALPTAIGSGYYTLSVCVVATGGAACAPSALAGPAYTIIATPVVGQSQAKDTQCTAFAVDSAGQQYAADSTGAYTIAAQRYCWSN